MDNLFYFKSKSSKKSEENLLDFIYRCKNNLTVFGEDLKWDYPVWAKVATFSKLGSKSRVFRPHYAMDKDFMDFAKSYLRYQQGHKPTKEKQEMYALKAIEAALVHFFGNGCISKINLSVLNKSMELAGDFYSAGSLYKCGREIERLAKFLTTNKLVSAKLDDWKSPQKRPDDSVRTGAAAKKEREKKLPNEAALNAIAEIFANNPTNNRDIFVTSIFAILMSAPSRISEVLSLPADCEYIEKDKNGVERYGLRFFSGKGYEGDIKWIPSVMVDITKEAIRRIKKETQPARDFALWLENNSDKFYRINNNDEFNSNVNSNFNTDSNTKLNSKVPQHKKNKDKHKHYEDNELLTTSQVCKELGVDYENSKADACAYLKNYGFKTEDNSYTLKTLWKDILKTLPDDYIWFNKEQKIKFSNALFCMKRNQLHATRGEIFHSLYRPDHCFFNKDVSGADHSRNIFTRNGYKDENGNPITIRSHQIRHLLNTIAQRGGLSNQEIAKWSGRADVKQNRVYNHMSEFEMVKMAEAVDITKGFSVASMEPIPTNLPVSTQEFNLLETGAVHITEYGYCVHDYTMSPCNKFRDCLNCTEQVCVKGSSVKLEIMKERLQRQEQTYQKVKQSMDEDETGADRWLEHHYKTLVRLKDLIAILENPEIPDGSQIKLRGNDFSYLSRVMDKEESKYLPINKELLIDESVKDEATDNVDVEVLEVKTEEQSILDDLKLIMGGSNGEAFI